MQDSASYEPSIDSEDLMDESTQTKAQWDAFPPASQWKPDAGFQRRVEDEIRAREHDVKRWEQRGGKTGRAFSAPEARKDLESLQDQYVAIYLIAERFERPDAA